jgi:flavin reductase (DIM6/NTAB) family NADH-FMN oxidoreductase RutF
MMHRSAVEHPSFIDEFEVTRLEKAPSLIVRPPLVAAAPVSMECEVDRIFDVGEFDDHVVWGRVVRFHIRDDLFLDRGRVDTAAMTPVGRLAAEYTFVDNVFTTPLDAEVLARLQDTRMHRLDGEPADWAAVAQKSRPQEA